MNSERIWVCPIVRREREVDEVRGQIKRLGGNIVFEDVVDLTDWHDCVDGADVIVILICRETINDPTIKDIVGEASKLGKRVVAIWIDEELASGGVPGFLDREGDAVSDTQDDNIKKVVVDGENIFVEPTGEPRPKQKLPRHKGH
ncbi:hypothetical protein [Rhizobium binae]|uniref:hypothetical protein n=1 Tax=Rhizobium binae TaxID=1138190 RepID=UPI001C837972|nr:hypothetical protein [Rhizobium binae]MBX4961368.1 hypothetical protein [Rhizobium binae]